ncbi:MAG: DUF1361 domain-containing protein [Flavobacterium sp.]|nr:DUF1361 domain-containing protein [Flavobacterium sp.]
MNSIFQLYQYNRKINHAVLLISMYCLALLLIRAKITQSIYLFFLIWNLMLAAIPYALSSYTSNHFSTIRKEYKGVILLSWLAFLPNSFYIITDLVHVVRSTGNLFYFDLVLISSFAITGFFLGLLSLFQVEQLLLKMNLKSKTTNSIVMAICFLNGFGIYIGRVLRFNSWDILSNPIELFTTLFYELLSKETILFSIHFGAFIYLTFLLYKNTNQNTTNYDQSTI